MKLLGLCVAMALAAGVAASPHAARAQALGEAATLGAGVSSAGSAGGSALGGSLGRAMGSEGSRIASSGKNSTSGGVMNLHWSREERERYERTARARAQGKSRTGSKSGSEKAQPDFVIYGADTQNADSGDASVSQPKAAKDKGSPGQGGKK